MRRANQRQLRLTIRGHFCIYCGEWATCLDHFPPYSACLSGFLLPACKECNSLAGTEYPFDFRSRAKFVIERLRARYRKVLETPEWSAEEARPLGYSLKQMVKSWSKSRKIAIRRTAWNAESYLALLPAAKRFVDVTTQIELMPEKQQEAFDKQFQKIIETEAA